MIKHLKNRSHSENWWMKDIKNARTLTILSSKVITPRSNRIYVDIVGRKCSGTRFRYQGEINLDIFRDIKLKSLSL